MSEHDDLRLAHRGTHVVDHSAHLVGTVLDTALHHGLDEGRLDRTAVRDGRSGHVEARQRDHEGESTLAVVPSFVPEFVPGIELAARYYDEVVAALIGDVPHAAARLGWGSDVLGYDTERSTDHGWGPHLHVFVEEDDVERVRARVVAGLPEEFRGWPTHFGWDDTPVQPWVEVTTLRSWLTAQLGRDLRPRPTTIDWLLVPQQVLLEVVAGAVFHDDAGELTALRRELDWYPDDLWLWLIACQWQRISQEEVVRRASGAGRRRARFGDHRGSPRARRHAALLPLGASVRAIQQVVRHRVLEARRCRRGRAAPRTPRARPRVRGGRQAPQRARPHRSRGTDAAPVLRATVPGDPRRTVRRCVPRQGGRRVAARPPPHRRDRPVVELVGRAVRRRSARDSAPTAPPYDERHASADPAACSYPRSRTVIERMRRSR